MISDAAGVLIIIFCFAAFAFLHSFLASNNVKKFLCKRFGGLIAYYRLLYVLFSLISFYFIYENVPHPIGIIYDLPFPFDFVVLIPQFISLAGIIWTLKYFDVREFLGISQILRWKVKEYDSADLDERLTLNNKGPYKLCRHPVYFFSITFLLFRAEMDLFYLTLLVSVIIYFYIGSFYEEKKLVEKFGEEYLNYRKTVPRIIPFSFPKTKTGA